MKLIVKVVGVLVTMRHRVSAVKFEQRIKRGSSSEISSESAHALEAQRHHLFQYSRDDAERHSQSRGSLPVKK